jgi:hypothetical protein
LTVAFDVGRVIGDVADEIRSQSERPRVDRPRQFRPNVEPALMSFGRYANCGTSVTRNCAYVAEPCTSRVRRLSHNF